MSDKICPRCRTRNSEKNLNCIKCSESLVYVENEPNWSEEEENKGFEKNYLVSEIFTFPFLISCIIAMIFSAIAAATHNPLFLAVSIIVVGVNFLPHDKDWTQVVREWLDKKRLK